MPMRIGSEYRVNKAINWDYKKRSVSPYILLSVEYKRTQHCSYCSDNMDTVLTKVLRPFSVDSNCKGLITIPDEGSRVISALESLKEREEYRMDF